jgi:hypothetical protein
MATINERIKAHRKAGNIPASVKYIYDACNTARLFLEAYNDGVSNPEGINGEFSNQVDALFSTEELTELNMVLTKASSLYTDYDTNHTWIKNIS